MICILIKRVEGPEKTTLPSLWISLCEILRSGLSDVWAPCVAMLLCCLTPYLCPCEPVVRIRPGRWRFSGHVITQP